jgi:GNAT superfamily N-acetyltransferase
MILRAATTEDIPAIARVHVDTWRSTYSGIIPEEYLANLSYLQRENSWNQIFNLHRDEYFTYVIENEVIKNETAQIVGFANGGLERTGHPTYKGELTAIYILQSYQGQGLGKLLVRAVVEKLYQMGLDSLLIWALADNPACKFYAALGGEQVLEKKVEIGGKQLIEVAYGWKNTLKTMGIDSFGLP